MKKLVFLSSMALDANISIIKRLRLYYDVYYIIYNNEGMKRVGNIYLDHKIECANHITAMNKLDSFIDLDKTYIVKKSSKLSVERILIEFETYKLIKSITPDIILTDAPNPNFLLSRFIYRKKVISLIHDPMIHSGEANLMRKLGNFFLLHLAKKYIIFNESQMKDFISRNKLKESSVCSVFLSQYEFLSLYNNKNVGDIASNSLKVLFFGRISPYKGLKYLLDGTVQFIHNYSDKITLIIAGSGSFDFSNYENIPQIHIINRFIDTIELTQMIQQTDIVACPYTDATQSGVIMSAYSFKKPVLATNVGGLPEMLDFGKSGMIIPPKNSSAIYSALVKLSETPALLIKYKENICKTYFNNGVKSWDTSVIKMKKFIDNDLH